VSSHVLRLIGIRGDGRRVEFYEWSWSIAPVELDEPTGEAPDIDDLPANLRGLAARARIAVVEIECSCGWRSERVENARLLAGQAFVHLLLSRL